MTPKCVTHGKKLIGKKLKASKGIAWMDAKEVTSIYNRFILKNLYGKLQRLNSALLT